MRAIFQNLPDKSPGLVTAAARSGGVGYNAPVRGLRTVRDVPCRRAHARVQGGAANKSIHCAAMMNAAFALRMAADFRALLIVNGGKTVCQLNNAEASSELKQFGVIELSVGQEVVFKRLVAHEHLEQEV